MPYAKLTPCFRQNVQNVYMQERVPARLFGRMRESSICAQSVSAIVVIKALMINSVPARALLNGHTEPSL